MPEWDGDAQADIGKAQETYATILGQVDGALLPEIAKGLGHPDAETRRWVVLALERHGAAARGLLEAALRGGNGRETCASGSRRRWRGSDGLSHRLVLGSPPKAVDLRQIWRSSGPPVDLCNAA